MKLPHEEFLSTCYKSEDGQSFVKYKGVWRHTNSLKLSLGLRMEDIYKEMVNYSNSCENALCSNATKFSGVTSGGFKRFCSIGCKNTVELKSGKSAIISESLKKLWQDPFAISNSSSKGTAEVKFKNQETLMVYLIAVLDGVKIGITSNADSRLSCKDVIHSVSLPAETAINLEYHIKESFPGDLKYKQYGNGWTEIRSSEYQQDIIKIMKSFDK